MAGHRLDALIGGPEEQALIRLAMNRLQGLRDGTINWASFFNPDTDRAHPTLSALPTTEQGVMVCLGGAIGNAMIWLDGFVMDYPPSRGADGMLTMAIPITGSSGHGLEYGRQLTAGKITQSSSGRETGVVDSGRTMYGARFYAETFVLSLGNPDIVVQDSSNTTNGGNGTWGTLLDMSIDPRVSGAARETVTGTIERGVRANVTDFFSDDLSPKN